MESIENKKTIQEAKDQVAFIRQQIALMGFNDSEFSDLDTILKDLEDEKSSQKKLLDKLNKF